ncbi:MAG: sugar nucleotide-binding protein, partial [Verrucomicrobiae bacterium]|nr:sugar nucleotide-binding protein [Verrucomicrobiae bacterium]
GQSKWRGEQAVVAALPKHIILRTAWVVSPYGHNFVKTMLRLSASKPELGVVDDQIGSPTYAPHLADAILTIAARLRDVGADQMSWGLYHATGAGEATWCALARETFRLSAERGGTSAHVSRHHIR